ncbi:MULTISPECIES: RagB/SusD family nutrient uptake outer membrane protein [unclassified Bacteroides]|uniref:RagB/SusD family nutrient uptake outer membrane protein n=1 Tax=unclassified Bacteroides TaxID=2646097 RepID=UPI0004E1C854|nr:MULTISPECIES: RagB/SusD family nutrient uptake outer membrane protein [unclassified Bacteroides]
MKLSNIKLYAAAIAIGLSTVSCEDFLDRPAEDIYNASNYYLNDAQCYGGANYLYSSPWYDFQRGFIKVGEVLSGNYYWGSSPYLTFTVNGTDEDLVNMSKSLWTVIGHSNEVYKNISASSGPSEAAKNATKGECLTWKALSYFFLVRSFGEVPIIHSTSEELEKKEYNQAHKVKKADVYEYIIMTLEEAMKLLPKSADSGRLDYYSAEGLLAKVYLTKAGVSGSLNQSDLDKAAMYAKDVIDNSGRKLEDNYEDIFKLANRYTKEGLIVWRWTAAGTNWTRQNSLQSDLAMNGIDDWGATWGGWNGLSVDLQEAFGVKLLEQTPNAWKNAVDSRIKGTMMLPGFVYSQFWQDKGGFDYIKFIYDYSVSRKLESATGANTVKHIYGNTADHKAGAGCSDARMASSVPTFILRLADVYLVYAEAKIGASRGSTTDASAIDAFYAVRHRAIKNAERPSSVSWDDIWKERRLELAMEGDRWYDYVRVSYYDPDFCVNELQNQKRNQFWGLDELYKGYKESGSWNVTSSTMYDNVTSAPSVASMMKKDPDSGKRYFFMPMPTDDVVFNPNLGSNVDGIHVDVRNTYSY